MRIVVLLAGASLAVAATAACSAKRPVLYPNDHLRDVGREVADADIHACLEEANLYVRSNKAGEVAKDTAKSGAIGGATGAVVGAVLGRPGQGAAAGAAGAATSGFLGGLFRSRDPDPLEQRYVERCLRERGYEMLGWR